MNNQVILSHSGKQHAYHVAKALHELDCLEKFYTSSYIRSQWLQQIIVDRGNQYWSRRFLNGLYGEKVEANWRFEFREIAYRQLYGQSDKTLNAVYQRDINFDKYMASRMAVLPGNMYWGFQGSSFESLAAARKAGKITICELATAHAPAAVDILGEEQKLHPEWADSFDNLTFPAEYYKRLCEEPHRADWVIGASKFTLETLKQHGVSDKKLKYMPLGFDLDQIPYNLPTENSQTDKYRPLRLLYAGRITQRKGIKYLLEAMKSFSAHDVELHLIGHVQGSGLALNSYNNFTWHAPISQSELFKQYQQYDALVLPSVFEGFGLVIVEAMAAGLPVITTPHSIGPELIDHGKNGYIVPIRDSNCIVSVIGDLIKKNGTERLSMRIKAREAALQFTWQSYQQRLKKMMDTL